MKPLAPETNRRIGRAMHTYRMLADGDRVLLAVSGGVDSLVLTWLLDAWRAKAPIDYEILAVHLDMGFGSETPELVEAQLRRLAVPYLIERTDYGAAALAAENGKSGCFHCARQRRNRLFELARDKGFNKLAFGHHREDLIETFFLNMLYSGNLSTMVPRQELFDGRLTLIRPLAMVDKSEIEELAAALGIEPVANPCPLADHSKRQEVRELLAAIYRREPAAKANIFNALANVKADYLLTPPPGSPARA